MIYIAPISRIESEVLTTNNVCFAQHSCHSDNQLSANISGKAR